MDNCNLFLAPQGCLAVPVLRMRLLMNHNLGLFQLSCCANFVHVSDNLSEF